MARYGIYVLPILTIASACTPAADDTDPAQTPGDRVTVTAETVASPAGASSDEAIRMQAEADADDACGASKVAPWIGQRATVPVRTAAAEAAGAASDRWIYPDSVVTQDFQPDRLNVIMENGSDKILSARCG